MKVLVKKPGFELIDIAGEHMAVPVGEEAVSFKGVVALSEAASFLLKNMQEPKSKEELAALLTQEYDVDMATAKADIEKLIKNLLDMGVIEE